MVALEAKLYFSDLGAVTTNYCGMSIVSPLSGE